ncbi:hypothetical protein GEV33_012301 [Tenebrio molitor]|uniref:Uncharacterized protein n=1 Tax=Tenebrio molitor TaxID=7067 RepID=A0A8J6H2B8_TENMO|nr:hypothetical protein GEV33_012301 [Tenebrio molitor]
MPHRTSIIRSVERRFGPFSAEIRQMCVSGPMTYTRYNKPNGHGCFPGAAGGGLHGRHKVCDAQHRYQIMCRFLPHSRPSASSPPRPPPREHSSAGPLGHKVHALRKVHLLDGDVLIYTAEVVVAAMDNTGWIWDLFGNGVCGWSAVVGTGLAQ